MKTNSVLIIDPVGIKAGMDYYDLNLAGALTHHGAQSYISSNFSQSVSSLKHFHSEKKASKAGKMKDLIAGFAKAILFARKHRIRYAIVHIFSTEVKDLLCISMAKAAGLKVIAIAHDISSFANADSDWMKNIIFNRYAELIVVHNQYSYQALSEIVNKKTATRINIIPHGSFVNLALDEVTKEEARNFLGIPAEKKVILFFGQIKNVKGLDILLNAMPMVDKEITLVIAGKPWKDDFGQYEALVEKHSLQSRVKLFIRYITDAEREMFFKAADMLVIPYRKIYQSGVLLMGMSYKLPVVASDLEANREVITHNHNGLLFRNGDPGDLAEKINTFFSSPDMQGLSGTAFEMMKEDYNWNTIAKKYIEVINENSNNRI